MKCGHCSVEFDSGKERIEPVDEYSDAVFFKYECPNCKRPIIFLCTMAPPTNDLVIPIWPFLNDRPLCPPEVPPHIAEDYQEACLVLEISPKASAALSRRCLQNLLHDVAGVRSGKKLDEEIKEVVNGGKLPSYIAESIQAIRHIGNLAAHPDENKNTGEIMPVEPHEAKWSLDILESLFDFYYVQPVRDAQKRAALNAKFQEAGKQTPMK